MRPNGVKRLLVSVRSRDEAIVAFRAGAHIIDIKEPLRGSLGRADWCVVQEVLQSLNRQVPISAALGELVDDQTNELEFESFQSLAFAKLGLANASLIDWRTELHGRWSRWPAAVGRIAVAYADWQTACSPEPTAVIEFAAEAGGGGVLIDTFDKRRGSLFDLHDDETVHRWINAIRSNGMFAAVAGSLSTNDLCRKPIRAADVVAVRGAVCATSRTSTIAADKIKTLLAAMPNDSSTSRLPNFQQTPCR